LSTSKQTRPATFAFWNALDRVTYPAAEWTGFHASACTLDPSRFLVGPKNLVVSGDGDELAITGGDEGVRFHLIAGKPIGEPMAWHGPIVMNTQAELREAISDLQKGTFIR